MATRRGICPYCKNEYIHNSIFLVNPEAANCFCGTNMHQISPKDAIDAYVDYINKAVKKADDLLNITCNPNEAYDAYAAVIDVDDTILHAYLGRILCLLYMSKTRKSYFEEARALLEVDSEKSFFTHLVNSSLVFEFFKRMVNVVEEYLIAVKKVLTFRKYFYDEECLALYFTHISGALNFEKEIDEIATEISNKDTDNPLFNSFLNFLHEKMKEKERILYEYDFITTDGKTYKFVQMKADNNAEIVVLSVPIVDTKTSKYRMATLNLEDKKLRHIKENIFRDYTKIIKARKASIFWCIFCLAISIAAGISIYFLLENFLYFIIAIVGCAVFLIISIILFVLIITWGIEITHKRKMVAS